MSMHPRERAFEAGVARFYDLVTQGTDLDERLRASFTTLLEVLAEDGLYRDPTTEPADAASEDTLDTFARRLAQASGSPRYWEVDTNGHLVHDGWRQLRTSLTDLRNALEKAVSAPGADVQRLASIGRALESSITETPR